MEGSVLKSSADGRNDDHSRGARTVTAAQVKPQIQKCSNEWSIHRLFHRGTCVGRGGRAALAGLDSAQSLSRLSGTEDIVE